MKRIHNLSENWLICLSSNSYYINVIQNNQITYRIDSDQPIIYYNHLPNFYSNQNKKEANIENINKNKIKSKSKAIDDYNLQSAYIIAFNRKFQWALYMLQKGIQPKIIFYGNLPFDKNDSNVSIINVHQINNNIVMIMADFQVFQLIITKKMKQNIISNEKQMKYVNIKYLSDQSKTPFLALKYLPSLQTNMIIDSLYVENLKNKSGLLYLVFQQKFTQKAKKLWSIYVLELDLQTYQFLTGKQCILNIHSKVILISSVDQNCSVLIQTQAQVYYWKDLQIFSQKNKIKLQNQEWLLKKYNEHQFIFALTKNYNKKLAIFQFYGFTRNKMNNLISLVKIFQSKDKNKNQLIFQKVQEKEIQTIRKDNKNFVNILQIFTNYTSFNQSYFLTETFQIYKLSNLQAPILVNHSSTILSAKIVSDKCFSLLSTVKKIGIKQEKIMMSNQQICRKLTSYKHNLMISFAESIFIENNSDRKDAHFTIALSSPVIGLLPLKFSINKNSNFNISMNSLYQNFNQSQILAMSEDYLISESQIIIIKRDQNKTKIIQKKKISVLFKDSIDFIHRALIYSKDLIIFGVDDQLHIFDGNFKLKFIYVFEREVKNIIKLNTVNVIGVQLYGYEEDNENQETSKDKSVKNAQEESNLQILIIGEDKIKFSQNVRFSQMTNYKHAQFQTTVNTVPYQITFIGNKLILCSSQQMHRYQTDKIKIITDVIPFPLIRQNNQNIDKNYDKNYGIGISIQVVPFCEFGQEKPENNFLMICSQNFNNSTRIFVGSISKKYLVKSNEQLTISYEEIIVNLPLKGQKCVFGAFFNVNSNTTTKYQSMIILTQKRLLNLQLCSGKFSQSIMDPKILKKLISHYRLQENKELQDNLKGLQKIARPIKICLCFNKMQQKVILYNETQVWYALMDKQKQEVSLLSVYTLINDSFMEFRNNLSVNELNDPNFIKLFSDKLSIKQVKYINKKSIIVLYQKSIIILQVGHNDALNVRQQIKFTKQNGQQQNHNQNQIIEQQVNININNNYSQISIVQLLDVVSSNCNSGSQDNSIEINNHQKQFIYMKDAQSRLYILKLNSNNEYQIFFDRNLEDDIVCIGRVNLWKDKTRIMGMLGVYANKQNCSYQFFRNCKNNQEETQQEMIVKKDGQLITKKVRGSNNKIDKKMVEIGEKAIYI